MWRRSKKIVAVCFVMFLLVPGIVYPLQIAHANDKIIGDFSGCAASFIADLVIGALSSLVSLSVPTFPSATLVKESVKDCIAWTITNAVIEEITSEITEYINEGFGGNPAYITDLRRELQSIADIGVLSIVGSPTELSGLPQEIAQAVRLQILYDYSSAEDFEGELVSSLDPGEYQAFIDGTSFDWNTWRTITYQEPQSNPYRAYDKVQREVNARITGNIELTKTDLEINRGFYSKPKCEEVEKGTQTQHIYGLNGTILNTIEVPITEADCETVTPGVVMQESLQKTLSTNLERIVQSDELNEALSLLFRGLFTRILGGDDGLRGIGDFIDESSGFSDITPGGTIPNYVLPTGSCDIPAGTTLARRDNRGVANLARYRRLQLTMRMNGGIPEFGVDSWQDGSIANYPIFANRPGRRISDATKDFCAYDGVACPGGQLSPEDADAILQVVSWVQSGGNKVLAVRFDFGGNINIDFYDPIAGGVNHDARYRARTIAGAVDIFCDDVTNNPGGGGASVPGGPGGGGQPAF